MSEQPVYLGDGLYATYQPYGVIELTTASHKREEADQVIYLEPEVAQALVKFIQAHFGEVTK